MGILFTACVVFISVMAVIILTSVWKIKAFISLFVVSLFLAILTIPSGDVVKTIREGFGNTMASIGLLIILGAMIGITLDRTGGMISIARFVLSKTGENKSAQALGITGFISGLPIFCDSGFIILSGLARTFSVRSKKAMAFMATVLATSLYSVHCLIPPHPGALAAAGMLQVNTGNLILAGALFAVPGAISAYLWSRWLTRRKPFPVADELISATEPDQGQVPPALLSFLPVAVPLLLITARSLFNLVDADGTMLLSRIFTLPGEPVIALAIGALLALMLLKGKSAGSMNSIFTETIEKSGPILIVTAAGGMFGMVIKTTGIGEALGTLLAGTSLGLIVPFLIAALMKSAQGSSTVAIITAASFVSPMLPLLGLDTESAKLFVMLSMGAGSMIVSHANDSYFWVVSNFSGMEPGTTLKVYTSSTLIMGLTVFSCTWITSWFVL
jgi:GntP family gluconate:H+ symporter